MFAGNSINTHVINVKIAAESKNKSGYGLLISATYGLKIVKNGPEIDEELNAWAVKRLGNRDAPVVKTRLLPVPSPIQHTNIANRTNLKLFGSVMSRKISGSVKTMTKI